MQKFIHNYIHCGLLGWFLEIIFTAFQAFRRRDFKLHGATSVWMFPIYGLASLLAPLCRLLRRRGFIFRGLVYTGLIFTGEFTTGMLLRKRELCPWNYERSRWNLARVIRPAGLSRACCSNACFWKMKTPTPHHDSSSSSRSAASIFSVFKVRRFLRASSEAFRI